MSYYVYQNPQIKLVRKHWPIQKLSSKYSSIMQIMRIHVHVATKWWGRSSTLHSLQRTSKSRIPSRTSRFIHMIYWFRKSGLWSTGSAKVDHIQIDVGFALSIMLQKLMQFLEISTHRLQCSIFFLPISKNGVCHQPTCKKPKWHAQGLDMYLLYRHL